MDNTSVVLSEVGNVDDTLVGLLVGFVCVASVNSAAGVVDDA